MGGAVRRGNGREGLREMGKDEEGEEGKPTQASNSKTAYGSRTWQNVASN